MDNFIFFPSIDPQHETSTLINMTRVYEGLHSINFRPDAVCLLHRHCILTLQVSYGDGVVISMAGKERILLFIDGLIYQADKDEVHSFIRLKEVIKSTEPKKFSFEEFELQQQFEESQNQDKERKM